MTDSPPDDRWAIQDDTYTHLLRHSGLSAVVSDTSGLILDMNPAFMILLGYGTDDVGLSVQQLLAPDDVATSGRAGKCLSGGDAMSSSLLRKVIHKDGSPRWIVAHLMAVTTEGQVRVLAIVEDWTDRHWTNNVAMEQALKPKGIYRVCDSSRPCPLHTCGW